MKQCYRGTALLLGWTGIRAKDVPAETSVATGKEVEFFSLEEQQDCSFQQARSTRSPVPTYHCVSTIARLLLCLPGPPTGPKSHLHTISTGAAYELLPLLEHRSESRTPVPYASWISYTHVLKAKDASCDPADCNVGGKRQRVGRSKKNKWKGCQDDTDKSAIWILLEHRVTTKTGKPHLIIFHHVEKFDRTRRPILLMDTRGGQMTNTTERRRMQNRIAQRNHRTSLPTFLCACVYICMSAEYRRAYI